MERDCLSVIRMRDIKKAKARKTSSPFDKTVANHYRNMVNNMKRELKRLYFSNAIKEATGNSGELWKVIRKLFNQSDPNTRIQEIDGVTDPAGMAELLNDFFQHNCPKFS